MGRLYDAYVEVGPRFTGMGDIKKAGDKAGKEYGKALSDAAAKAAQANVRKLGEALGKARQSEADAAGKVRVAEAKLNEVRANSKAKASQVAAAEEALAAAQRKSATASDTAKAATESLEKARKRVAATAGASGDDAGKKFGSGLRNALSRVKTDDAGSESGKRFGIGFSKRLPAIGGRVTSFFKTGVGAAAGLAAGAVIGGGLVAGFQKALEQGGVKAKLEAQLDLSGADAAKAGKVAGDLFKANYGESLSGVNEALKSVVQNTGITLNSIDLKPVTAKVLDVVSVFDQDLGGVTRAVGQSIRTGLAKNATEALDFITKGFQVGDDKAQDFLDTLNEYGTQFRKVGIDGKTATGLISQGLKAGARDADIVADAIKEFSIRAVDGSSTTAAGFKAVGLDAKKMAEQIAKGGKPASDGLQLVLDRLRGIKDPVKQSQAAIGLFGTQAEDLGKALFALDPKTAVAALGQVAGAADRLDKKVGTTPQAIISGYWRTIKQGSIDTFGGVISAFASGETSARGFQGFLERLAVGSKAVFQQIRTGASAFSSAFKGEGVTSDGFVGVMERIGVAARSAFGFFKAEVLPRLKEFGGYVKSTVIPIIGELVQDRLAKMGQMFSSIKSAIQDNRPELEKLGGALLSLGKFLIENVLPPFEKMQNNIFPAVGQGASILIRVIGALVTAFLATKGAVSTAFGAVKSAVGTALSAVSTAADAVKGAFSTAFSAVSGAVSAVIGAVTGAFTAAVGFIKSVWSTIVSAVSGPVTAVVGVLQAIWSRIYPILVLPFYIAKKVISEVFAAIQAGFMTVVGWVTGAFSAAWSAVSGVLAGPLRAALSVIQILWGRITTSFSNAKNWVTGAFSAAWSAVKAVVSVPVAAAKTALDIIWARIRAAFGAVKDYVTGAFARSWAGLKKVITAPVGLARDAISTILGAAKGGLRWVFSTAVSSISTIWNRLQELAKKPIRFIINTVLNEGLIGGFNWIANKFDAPTIKPIPLPKGFASGGRIPGRASSKDNTWGVHKGRGIPLATGEFITNAKQTARNLPLLQAINAGAGFAGGGLFGNLKDAVSSAYGAGKNFVGDVADFTKNPGAWLKKRFSGPLGKLSELGNSSIAKVVTAVPRKIADTVVGKAKDLLKGLFGGGPNIPVGNVVNFRGEKLNQRTIAMLLNAEAMLRRTFHIMQGSYSTRVSASGSTHAGGGAMDTDSAGAGWDAAVRALRAAGFAAWHRTPAQGPWGHHIHSIAIGDPSASPAAKGQVRDFQRGGDGLGGMALGGRIGIYDRGGRWPSGTLGVNLSGQTETVRTAAQEASLSWPMVIHNHIEIGGEVVRVVRTEIDASADFAGSLGRMR